MVPASILVLFASTLLAKNVYQAGFHPGASEDKVMRLSRAMVVVIAAAALVLALFFPNALVNLLLIGYDGVSQFFPGRRPRLVLEAGEPDGRRRRVGRGIAIAAFLVFGKHDPFLGMNAGFVALAVECRVTVA